MQQMFKKIPSILEFQVLHSTEKPKSAVQVTFLTFGTEDIHQIHEIIEYHIFIWNCRSFEHNKHSVSSFSYQFSFSTLTELAQTNVTTKLLSKAAISNEYMIFYHFMILVDIIHSKCQKSYLYIFLQALTKLPLTNFICFS